MERNENIVLVDCPNLCFNGEVKHYPHSERALFDMIKCQFCKGRGKVSIEEAAAIEKIL